MISIVQADVIAGNGPDIAQIIFADFGCAAENFGVPALEDIVPARELAGHVDGLFPKGLELGRLDGKTCGLAYAFSPPALFCNADLFRAAGLNPDAPPRTWDEVGLAAHPRAKPARAFGGACDRDLHLGLEQVFLAAAANPQ